MSAYSIALFLHIVGALGAFSVLALEWGGLYNLRRAETRGQFQEWNRLLSGLHRIGGPTALLLIVTGLYMAAGRWGNQVWIDLGLAGLVALVLTGARVIGPRLRAIARDVAAAGALTPALQARLRAAMLLRLMWARTGLGLGIVFLMTTKPGFGQALVDIGVSIAMGLAAGLVATTRGRVPGASAQEPVRA